jgi:hypothetical protein
MPTPEKYKQNNQIVSRNSIETSDGKAYNMPEPIRNIVTPGRKLVDSHKYASTVWKDNAYAYLENNRFDPIMRSTLIYLNEAWTTIDILEDMLKKSESLESWRAGLGSWLSFLDIKMVCKREISKLFDGDGWGSIW